MKSVKSEKKELTPQSKGSPDQGESVFILIGKIQKPHGVDGDLTVFSISDESERFSPGNTVWIGEDHTEYKIQSRRFADRTQIIHFRGLNTPEVAGLLRNQLIYTKQSMLPDLPEGEFYHFQLIGLTVLDENGVKIGVLNEVLTTGANDVYLVIDADGQEHLFPAIKSVIIRTDLVEQEMIIRQQEWL